MQFKIILKTLAGLLCVLGILLFIPTIFSFLSTKIHSGTFLAISILTITTGTLLWLLVRKTTGEINARSGFAIVTFSWLLAGLIGALPYWLTGTLLNPFDAIFESFSGFCGSGASTIASVEAVDRSILLWRSMTQWLGGLGIILFFIAILPILGVGGVQLFKAEASSIDQNKFMPRVQDVAKNLWLLYIAFTSLIAIALRLSGVNGFDAVNHAMTTLATGGFSTKDSGIAYFSSPTVDYIIIAGMLLGALSFNLHFRLFVQGNIKTFFDTELKSFVIIIIGATLVISAAIIPNYTEYSYLEIFRMALFTVTTTISTTGYTNYDYTKWPANAQLILILLMFMGGMTASTAGGMKCMRLIATFKLLLNELKQIIHPNAYLTVKNNDHSIPRHVINSIWAFLFIYLWIFSILTAILTLDKNLDLVSATTAAVAALSNVGPAMGELGPYANYADLSNYSKLSLALGMLLGRLEFFTVLVLLTPDYWRK